jgi:small subunit ribosomal protein S20
LATHQSAIKRHRQNLRRRARNIARRSQIKTSTKKVLDAVTNNELDNAQAGLLTAIRTLCKARDKKLYHKNTVARKISKLTKKVNALKKTA